jgi:hypothetical protein
MAMPDGFNYTTDYSEQHAYDRMGIVVKHVVESGETWEFMKSAKMQLLLSLYMA